MNTIDSSIMVQPIKYNGKQVQGRIISVSSILNIDRDSAWDELQKSDLLRFVSDGMTKFGTLPLEWEEGEDVSTVIKAKLFGCIPLGAQNYSICFNEIDPENFSAQTIESGDSVKVWNHAMEMESTHENHTLYTDTIEIYSGILTGIISLHVQKLYRHRHQRWQQVADILRNGGSTSDQEYLTTPFS